MNFSSRKVLRLAAVIATGAVAGYALVVEHDKPPPQISGTVVAVPDDKAVGAAPQDFIFRHREAENDCGLERAVDKTWCLPDGWRVTGSAIRKIAAECKSTIAEPATATPRCVQVRAQVAGCGYEGFFSGGRCKGRGFVEYEITLTGVRAP